MPTTGLGSVRTMRRRTPLAPASFNLIAGLVATSVAVLLLVVGLLVTTTPPRSLTGVLFAWAPTGAGAALPVIWSRARRERDPLLGWFAAGLAVCLVAMVLQVLSLPTVAPDGGVLGTGFQSNPALYLLFHLALYASALAGAADLKIRLAPAAAGLGMLLVLAVSLDLVPIPELLAPDQSYNDLLIGTEVALAALGLLALVAWVRCAGSPTAPVRAWIGLALLLSIFELSFNALSGARYDPVWWSSLTMRLATFGVLGGGCLWSLLRDLARVERYSEVELDRRDRELRGTVAVTDLLLSHAQRLGQCRTAEEVADAVAETLTSLNGVDRVSVATGFDGALRLLGTGGAEDEAWRRVHAAALHHDKGMWWESPEPIAEAGASGMALAAVALEASGEPVGSLLAVCDGPRQWNAADRELLTGVADQSGPALARAELAERDRHAALTLQDALAPRAPATLPGLELALRYVPAVAGTRVGGDWVDCWALPDGRVALVVGDVVGKGLRAAATMGRLRAALRALAGVDPRPSVVLARLDEAQAAESEGMVATVLYVLLDPLAGNALVGRAGHLPMLLAEADGSVRVIDEGGSPPIGVGDGSRPDALVALRGAATLALFTDGLVERRHLPLSTGLAALQRGLSSSYVDAEGAADALMRLGPSAPTDDIALLVVRVADPLAEPKGAVESAQPTGATISHQTHLPESLE